MPKVLLVTVTKVEAQAVLELFPNATGLKWIRKFINAKPYYGLGNFGGVDLYMVQSEMGAIGPGAALITVVRAIQDIRPVAVIMVGIAFGVNPGTQQLGDILVSRQIRSYEQQKVKGRQLIPRGDRVTASPRLIGLFRDGDLDWNGAKVHFGLVLSGEKLVMSRTFRAQLLRLEPEAIGGEMEGAGIYTAASETKVDWLLVKAICDWADESKNYESQSLAAQNAVNFVIHVLGHGGLSATSNGQMGTAMTSASIEEPSVTTVDSLIPAAPPSDDKSANLNIKGESQMGESPYYSDLGTGFRDAASNEQRQHSKVASSFNPNNPFLLAMSGSLIDELGEYRPLTQLRFKCCYWGRSTNFTQLEKYLIQKKLANPPVDVIHLPYLKSAKGNTCPVAWMEIHDQFSYLYSGWGNRHPLEDITIISSNDEKNKLTHNQPLTLFGFETICFEGQPNVKQLYVHPIPRSNLVPAIKYIELLQNHGLWASAGYAWLRAQERELALAAFEKALGEGLDEETSQQLLIKIHSIKREI